MNPVGKPLSKPVPVLLGLLIALLAGGAAGYVIGAQGQGTPPATATPDSAKTPAPQPSPQAPEQAPPANSPDAAAPAGLAGWLATLADEKPRPGTGRIHGRVATADGREIAGITVSAAAQYPHKWRNTPDVPLEEIVEDTARRTHFQRAGISTAQTNPDGRYEFANLGDYEYMMSAKGAAHSCQAEDAHRPVRPGAEVNFTATPVCTVTLDVRLPDGSQPAEADIWFQIDGGGGHRWTPTDTQYRVPAGKARVTAAAGSYEEFVADPLFFECNEGDPPREVKLQLKVVPGIHCTVSLPPAFAKHLGARVALIPDPADELPVPGTLMHLEDAESLYEDPEATFTGLTPGPHRLVVACGNHVLACADVQLGQEFRTVAIRVPEPRAADYVIVRVRAPDGSPVNDARLHVHVPFSYDDDSFVVLNHTDGCFWVHRRTAPPRFRQPDPWTYTFTAVSNQFGAVTAEYAHQSTQELELRFKAPAFLLVTVPGATKHPLARRLQLRLWCIDEGGESWHGNTFEPSFAESDTVKSTALAPGRCRLELRLERLDGPSGVEDGHGTLATWEFELSAGDNAKTCPMPQLCRLTLNIADPDAARRFSLSRKDNLKDEYEPAPRTIRARMVFTGLLPGEWTARTSLGEMTFTLAGDTELTLTVRKYDCFALAIESKGKITELGLLDGDKVIRIDGQEVTIDGAGKDLYEGSLKKDSTTWTVIRAGGQVDVTFSGKALSQIRLESRVESLGLAPGFRD